MTPPPGSHLGSQPDLLADLPPDLPPDMPADWPHRHHSRIVTAAGHRWHLQQSGSGPLVLLLHGAGASTHSWRGLLPLLAAQYTVVALDLPGQGFTRVGRKARAGLDPMAADIAALCAHLALNPAAIIGHSAGAALGLRLAEILPQPPRAIVGINAALGNFDGFAGLLFPILARALTLAPFVPQLFARLTGTTAKVTSLLTSTGSPLPPEGIEMYRRLVARPAHVEATLAMMAQWKLDGLLARLPAQTTPCLLIASQGDLAVPAEVSRRAAARIPGARFHLMPGWGHLVHEEAPDEVAALLLPYLSETC